MEWPQVYEMFLKLKEELGEENLLEQLFQAMDTDEAYENLEYIAIMNDIDL